MLINFQKKKIFYAAFLIFLLPFQRAVAQINEPANSEVYSFLSRMSQKGFTPWNDYQLPNDRRTILVALNEIKSNLTALSKTEREELSFYLKDFVFDSLHTDTHDKSYFKLFTVNQDTRYRTLLIQEKNNKLFLEPLFGVSYLISSGKSNRTYFGGVRLAGYFGKHLGINFSYRDITEKGDTIDFLKDFTSQQGIVSTGQTSNALNYSKLNFNIGYTWKKGALVIGKDDLVQGYGTAGNMILSGKAPSFPYILINFKPWKWVHFNYFHGWLQSDIIDSAKTYNTGSGVSGSERIIYRSKFMASHSLVIKPLKGLDLGIGESIVYSDKINIAYLIPVNFFKAYDHYTSNYIIEAGNNAQFFAFINSRNHIKKTHLFAQIFIDEIKFSKIFNKTEKRNQLGYTVGINRTDVFLNYLSIGVEYSRINPFVYNNLIPTQTYTSNAYLMGDWMGNNADRLFIYADYTPLPKLKIHVEFQNIRKGAAGDLYQQYYQQPQPEFLFQKIFTYREIAGNISYELINTLKLYARFNTIKWNYITTGTSSRGVNLGFTYGL